MRVIFAGTPEVAVPTLQALANSNHDLVRVISRPDAPLGRKRVLTPSPVSALADQLSIPLTKGNRFDERLKSDVSDSAADIGVVVAFGALIPDDVLEMPKHGWINLHFSLLPKWRGAAPVQRSIIAGDKISGVSVFQLVSELDAGDVFAQEPVPVPADSTASDFLHELSLSGPQLVLQVLAEIAAGTAVAKAQIGASSYAHKLSLNDGYLDLSASAAEVYDRFRGVTDEPGAWVVFAGERLKITGASFAGQLSDLAAGELRLIDRKLFLGAASGAILLEQVQPFAKKAMNAADWWRGLRLESAFVDDDFQVRE